MPTIIVIGSLRVKIGSMPLDYPCTFSLSTGYLPVGPVPPHTPSRVLLSSLVLYEPDWPLTLPPIVYAVHLVRVSTATAE